MLLPLVQLHNGEIQQMQCNGKLASRLKKHCTRGNKTKASNLLVNYLGTA